MGDQGSQTPLSPSLGQGAELKAADGKRNQFLGLICNLLNVSLLKRKCSQHPRPSVQVNTRGLRSRRVPWFQNPFRPHLFESEVSRMHTAVNMCVCFHFSLCILGNGCVCPPALLTGGGSGSPFQVQRRQLSAGQLPNKTFCQEARVGGRKNPNKPVLQARCCHCF